MIFDFSPTLNLPLLWGVLIAFTIFLYVLLDGFDLGTGILFPFAPTDSCRNTMMNAIAPFWDGNETWLVLGGMCLLAAFPIAHSILLPAFYIPVILMLLGLIFRGVAFEFRFKATGVSRKLWDYCFHFGSLGAGFFQGVMLGAFVQGVQVKDQVFVGSHFDWLSPFSLTTGVALVFGYALLGSCWVIMKTEGITQMWARRTALYVAIYVVGFMGLVSFWAPFLHPQIWSRYFTWPNILFVSPLPLLTLVVIIQLFRHLLLHHETRPFIYAILLFCLAYAGLAIAIWPWLVPYHLSLSQASASGPSQSLLLVAVGLCLPFVLGYTAYSYYVFRGKSTHHPMY